MMAMPRANVPANWAELPDEQLLDLRLADLPLKLEGTVIEGRASRSCGGARGARAEGSRSIFTISDEWFTPDGTATHGGAVLHDAPAARAAREDRRCWKSRAASTNGACASFDTRPDTSSTTSYKLRLRRQRRALFGSSNEPYPEFYVPKPYSKAFVQHIDPWYAQSHPDEDFAETFAVWLTPESNWKQRYAGWPAFNKLEYVDDVDAIAARPQAARRRAPTKSIRCGGCVTRCGGTIDASAAITASTIPSSTIASCDGCSRMRRSSPAT